MDFMLQRWKALFNEPSNTSPFLCFETNKQTKRLHMASYCLKEVGGGVEIQSQDNFLKPEGKQCNCRESNHTFFWYYMSWFLIERALSLKTQFGIQYNIFGDYKELSNGFVRISKSGNFNIKKTVIGDKPFSTAKCKIYFLAGIYNYV